MHYQARKGQVSAGEAIGILLLETAVPFIPGDVANATTYDFPVRFQKVEGLTVKRALGKDPEIFGSLSAAAESLVSQGVRAVTGDCGFMGIHQKALSRHLRIPVFLSSLSQIPFITAILPEDAAIGILTASGKNLDDRLLSAMGVTKTDHLVIEGLETRPHFHAFAIAETGRLDAQAVEKEVVDAARQLVADHPESGAILLECSLLPPYAAAVAEAVDLPVFDYITMIRYVFSAVVRHRYTGFM